MSTGIANVVVNVLTDALTEPFTYRIPEALQDSLQIGSSVLVPFGTRQIVGYIAGFESSYSGELKEILSVLEPEPLFDQSLLSLASWMAARYQCGLAEALRCIVPWPMASSIRTTVHMKQAADPAARISPVARDILAALEKAGGSLDLHDLRNRERGRDLSGPLKRLSELGCIEVTRFIKPPQARAKRIRTVELCITPEQALIEASLLKRAPRQAHLLRICAERNGETIPVSELGEAAAGVSALERKGFVRICLVEVRRNPWRWETARQNPLVLSPDQIRTLDIIRKGLSQSPSKPVLVHGITASGKTEVYLRAIEETLRQGRNAIVLVPEISLTAQVLETFKGRFGDDVAVLHSKLSVGERYDEWRRIRKGEARVVLGARSGIFAPVPNPGLIILDEEHEPSYKQDSTPRYHARDVAARRAAEAGALLVLGSATPSVETYFHAVEGRLRLAEMPVRIDDRPLPAVRVVDLRKEFAEGRRSVFSTQLREAIGERLSRNEQTILFLNRRGFSTILLCRDCGFVARCPNCSVSLTYHASVHLLRCHHCDHFERAPETCPGCKGVHVRHFGIGTEKVEEETRAVFPDARILRMDRDTTSAKDAHVLIHRSFKGGEADILIGTQMVAKGFDFPRVTLVGVITADTALNMPDFRASERAFQLLTQVSGRAGRGDLPGEVLIQTFDPDHYSIRTAVTQDYKAFYEREIENRREVGYPPFSYLVRVVVSDPDDKAADAKINAFAKVLKELAPKYNSSVRMLGPTAPPLAKLKGLHRRHLQLKAQKRALLQELVRETVRRLPQNLTGFSIDVDPQSLL